MCTLLVVAAVVALYFFVLKPRDITIGKIFKRPRPDSDNDGIV